MNLENLREYILSAAAHANLRIIDEHVFEEKTGAYLSVPGELHIKVYRALEKLYPNGIYRHQALAIQTVLDGDDLCLATPTASGKSLVFMTAAADAVLTSPQSTVLALYPAKALIQDQIAKWKKMVDPLGISVGFIDGSVPGAQRLNILRHNRIILMTPDVLQAWLMANLKTQAVAGFMKNLQYLILDEAHIYSGVFGSNMAYLLRRVQAASGSCQIISSTATIGDPEKFIQDLTGRPAQVFTERDDASPNPPKAVMLAAATGDNFKQLVSFTAQLARRKMGKFIAFGDSRRLVETFVAATKRLQHEKGENAEEKLDDLDCDTAELEELQKAHILPYRAGYEEEDRRQIQAALEQGELRGVVATSGLELGIDIGEISAVVLLGTPPSIQAFRQRMGRIGRRHPGVCVLVDTKGLVSTLDGGLAEYLKKPSEKGWLYLDNRYIQYTNALCAALETASAPDFRPQYFKTLPANFLKLLNNEMVPTENLPPDFFALKQRAQSGPHFEFPVRSSGIEKSFAVRRRQGATIVALGNLSHSQVLREGYPGAVYYYMAQPFRVYEFNFRQGEINVRREHYYTTKPIAQNMVFPKFPNGVLSLLKSDIGFLAEAELQVSERVLGFTETRGNSKHTHLYEQGSDYSERPLVRMFETTGICWCLPDMRLMSEQLALVLVEAFCLNYGIHSRDLGVGTFHTNVSPLGGNKGKGICIYDATHGSLRLTQQLAENFGEIVEEAIKLLISDPNFDKNLALNLAFLKECFTDMKPTNFEIAQTVSPSASPETQDWVEVFARGEKVLYKTGNGDLKETFIHEYRYTPVGLMYVTGGGEVKGERITTRATEIFAFDEKTKSVQYNLYTGDIRHL